MIALDPFLLLLLIACLYIIGFGALSVTRREGLSPQFAVEVIVLTALLVGGSWLLGRPISPILFLLLLYVVTMRSRLIVDLANVMARRERYDWAFRLYRLGLAWWPDAAARNIVRANLAAAELHSGQAERAIHTLESLLDESTRPPLGLRYETVSRYNLGLAYQNTGDDARAARQFNLVIELLPGSPAAQAARAALKRRHRPPAAGESQPQIDVDPSQPER